LTDSPTSAGTARHFRDAVPADTGVTAYLSKQFFLPGSKSRIYSLAVNTGIRDDTLQWRRQRLSLLMAVLAAAGMYLFYDHVDFASLEIEDALLLRPRGNFSDLYPAWLGTRELLLNGHDPYSPDVTAEIQKGVWGRTVDARNPGDPKEESRFAYPLHVVFIFAPIVLVPFSVARVLFIVAAITAGAWSVSFWLRLFHPGSSGFQIAIFTALFLGSWPFVLALQVHQPALIVFALMSAAIAALAAGQLWAGGVLLALATIKPQSVIGIVGWLLLWSLCRWRDRKGLVLSFSLTLAVMFIIGEMLLPGWIWEWREALSAYMRYSPLTGAVVELMFGRLGEFVGALVIGGVVVYCWKARRDAPNTDRFKLAPPLILSANLFVTPVWHAYDLIFLLPPVLLIWAWRSQFDQLKPVQRGILRFSALALLWQWFAAALALTIVIVDPRLALNLRILPYFSILLLPAATLTSLILIARARLSSAVLSPALLTQPVEP
jgi:Glycosyltransferase family 87